MSDPQTVREAKDWRTIRQVVLSTPDRLHMLAELGIDPDMPVETLKRRLLWGERVEQEIERLIPTQSVMAWLIEEEA